MPTLRIMMDGRPIFATPGSPDVYGVPAFYVAGGNTERVALDFTAWLGAATLAASTWVPNGATLTGEAVDGAMASALVTVPQQPDVVLVPDSYGTPAVTLGHIAQASDGRVLRQLIRLYPQPSATVESIVFDLAILG